MRTAKTLIKLGGCPGWSESSLGAQSLCWFCHEAAHFVLFLLWSFVGPNKNICVVQVTLPTLKFYPLPQTCVSKFWSLKKIWSEKNTIKLFICGNSYWKTIKDSPSIRQELSQKWNFKISLNHPCPWFTKWPTASLSQRSSFVLWVILKSR